MVVELGELLRRELLLFLARERQGLSMPENQTAASSSWLMRRRTLDRCLFRGSTGAGGAIGMFRVTGATPRDVGSSRRRRSPEGRYSACWRCPVTRVWWTGLPLHAGQLHSTTVWRLASVVLMLTMIG